MAEVKQWSVARGRVKASITKLEAYVKGITSQNTLTELNMRYTKLGELEKEFIIYDDFLNGETDYNSEYDEIEDRLMLIKEKLLVEIEKRTPSTSNNAENKTADVDDKFGEMIKMFSESQKVFAEQHPAKSSFAYLSKLNIKHFNGDFKDWPTFKDQFLKLIHNEKQMSDIVKFSKLKELLGPEPSKLIENMIVTEGNYNNAWAKLEKRYSNNRKIATSYIEKFLNQKLVKFGNVDEIRSMVDNSESVIMGLDALHASAQNRDIWLIHILLNKLDDTTRKRWAEKLTEKFKDQNDQLFPTVQEFFEFLHERRETLENQNTKRKVEIMPTKASFHVTKDKKVCPKCKLPHSLFKCYKFKALSVKERRSFTEKLSLCFKCLSENHQAANCTFNIKCQKCNGNHNVLLHLDSNTNNHVNMKQEDSSGAQGTNLNDHVDGQQSFFASSVCNCNDKNSEQVGSNVVERNLNTDNDYYLVQVRVQNYVPTVCNMNASEGALLPTAEVLISDSDENIMISSRILLDSGSELSFISESLVQKLILKRRNSRLAVVGLSSVNAGSTKGIVSVKLRSHHNKAEIMVQAHVINNVSSRLPSKYVDIRNWSHIKSKPLADDNFNCPRKIDMLLGSQYFFDVLKDGRIVGEIGLPSLQNTMFGWVVAGSLNQITTNPQIFTTMVEVDNNIDITLRRFWEIEEVSDKIDSLCAEENICEEHFNNTLLMSSDNKFEVRLPFIKEQYPLGNSLKSAVSRMHSIERRLSHDNHLYEQYREFMHEYINLGHMTLIPENEIEIDSSKSYYLPHHPVIKPHSQTTKCRVVFDASNKTSSGFSLNDNLAVGPTIQRDLQKILLNFRLHKVAICGDVEKMYRMVMVNKKDQDFQRIVWRYAAHLLLQHYRLRTVTYGTACAPFLATCCLNEIGLRCKSSYPRTSDIIINDFYVDDLTTGASSIEEAKEICSEVSSILEKYGFILRKWVSNSPEVLLSAVSFETEVTDNLVNLDEKNSVKILGLYWQPNNDIFTYKVSLAKQNVCTKRIILSEASKIYDPLGFISPSTILVKIMLQQLWLEKFDWDDPLPLKMSETWLNLQQEWLLFEKLTIPRYVHSSKSQIHLVGFCDASEVAYSAVIYIKCLSSDGNVTVSLLTSKTKVAPLKKLTIPRLELCGALLLTKLLKFVQSSLKLNNAKITAFTDSSVVLSWLSSNPRRWKPYVANRLSQIIELLPVSNWKHVRSKSNPADCASRGIMPQNLLKHPLWWNGPSWLEKDMVLWPNCLLSNDGPIVEEEARKHVISVFHVNTSKSICHEICEDLFKKHSSLLKILHIISYCCRIVKPNDEKFSFISCAELNNSLKLCINWAQNKHFSSEIHCLKNAELLKNRSCLLNLNPLLDDDGILRVGGRLENVNAGFDSRHPFIIPKGHILGEVIIRELHYKHLHAGPSLLVNIIRQKYWIIGCRNLVKKIIRNCIICVRNQAKTGTQIMSSLPKERVNPTSVFQQVGLDYAGPFSISWHKGRHPKVSKGYLAIFVCLWSKATHLELVNDMTSESFIACLKRFVSRRGLPAVLFSDNGTNFVGAKKKLLSFSNAAFQNRTLVGNFLAENNIDWKMIPPSAPHFGGIWEAGVKAAKFHLKRVVGEQILTFEELITVFSQIESQLNSRPLTPMYDGDITNLQVLTPGHFIIGRPLIAVPEKDLLNVKVPVRDRWSLITKIQQNFWSKWKRDYLNTLQQRKKWFHQQQNFNIGDVVLIKDENTAPNVWPLGRIIKVYPGQDNNIRVVTLKTSKNELTRPITKLVKLPVTEEG